MPRLARRSIPILAALLGLLATPLAAQDCLDYTEHHPDLAPTGPHLHALGDARAVALAGSTLCLATETCVQLWDVADPLAPVWLGKIAVWADRLVAHGGMLYAARYDHGLHAIDISDPAAPMITATNANDRGAYDLLIHRDHLYVTPKLENLDNWFGIMVYDLADPARPQLVNEVQGGAGFSICLLDDVLIMANYDPVYANVSWLTAVDVSDPANPVYHDDWVTFSGRTRDVAGHGHHVYAATDTDGLYAIDASDPENLVVVGQLPELGLVNSVAVVGQTAWVTVHGDQDDNTLVALSVADPAAPMLQGSARVTGYELDHAEADGWMYLATELPGPVVAALDDPDSPATHAWSGLPPAGPQLTAAGIAVAGDLVYLGSEIGDALRIIDMSDPQAPAEVASVASDLVGGDVANHGSLLFQMMREPSQPGERWLDAYSVVDPHAPVWLGRGAFPDFTIRLAAAEGAVYSTLNGTIWVMDVRDPTDPRFHQALNPPGNGNGRDLLVHDGHLYAPLTSSGLVIYECVDPLDPHVVAVVPLPWCLAVDIEGDLAYATDYYLGLCVIDISDPTSPVVLRKLALPESAHRVQLDGSKLYLTSLHNTATVFDLGDPLQPELEGSFFQVGGAAETGLIGPWLLLAESTRGLQFAWRACPAPLAAPDGLPTVGPTLSAFPNPFNPRTVLSYEVTTVGQAELTIHDLAGRRVVRLAAGWHEAGLHRVDWDGRDASRRALPSGTYLARLTSASGVRSSKLALIR